MRIGSRLRTRPLALTRLLLIPLLLTFATAAAQPRVVVSLHPLYDLMRQLAADDAEVVRMLPPGASDHGYDPTPRDVMRVVDADLIVLNGGLDLWLLDLAEASGSAAPVVELIALPSVLAALRADFADLVPEDASGVLPGFNVHVWLDPLLMAAAVPDLAEALAAVDPASAAGYRARAEDLVASLLALHDELSETLAPVAGAPLVPFHHAWPYFAARYGLRLIVEIEPYPGREPSPAYLREALRLVRDSGAKTIFSEVQLNRRPAEVLAAEAGVALFELDPLGGFPGRESYQEMMRWNAAVLLEGLQ